MSPTVTILKKNYLSHAALSRSGSSSINLKKISRIIACFLLLRRSSPLFYFTVTTVTNVVVLILNSIYINMLLIVTVNKKRSKKAGSVTMLLHAVTNCYTSVTANCHKYKQVRNNYLLQSVTVNCPKPAGQRKFSEIFFNYFRHA